MKQLAIQTLAQIIKAHLEPDTSHESRVTGHEPCFTGVSIDSRTTRPGDCFFAIPGENFDGHNYIADAFARGAVCAVVSKHVSSCVVRDAYRGKENTQYAIRNTQYNILKVDDTVNALGDFARHYRRHNNFKVIAITGSVGKTTTRQIIYHVLSRHYRCHQAPKNYNNNIGLPLTLLGADPEHRIIIAELGSSSPGEITYLARIAQPDIAVITNVHPAHLEGFGDRQAIIQEKLSIAEQLKPNGLLIINADILPHIQKPTFPFITFGYSDHCDIEVRNIDFTSSTSRFTIDDTQIDLPLLGRGNVENALAAWSVCSQFGVTIDDFARAVETLPPVPMRTELLQIGTLMVFNDCYNANPASMKNALDCLKQLAVSYPERRTVFICGPMAELGPQTADLHAQLGAFVAQAKVQLLLAVGDFAQIVAEAAKTNADYDLQIKCFKDTLSACNNLKEFIKDYDIILVKGSRIAALEMAVEKLKELFGKREKS